MLYIRAHQLFKTNETKTLHKVGSRVYSEGIHPRVNPFGVYESAITRAREVVRFSLKQLLAVAASHC